MRGIPKTTGTVLGLGLALMCLWVAQNALVQTRKVYPEETTGQILRALVLGHAVPLQNLCPASVHDAYTTTAPDGKTYPTWHPPFDAVHKCYFDHEHGSDPHQYVGFASSGMPAFRYTAGKAGLQEPHAGYKVFVTNDDLHGRAWMITLNQDTGNPQRAWIQYHTLDWNISTTSGQPLADLHLLGDFGYAVKNCQESVGIISHSAQHQGFFLGQHRAILTTDCAAQNPYESWIAGIQVAGVFEATPMFGVNNPLTAVDLQNPGAVHSPCEFRPQDGLCQPDGYPWTGGRREVLHPGQYVHNQAAQAFTTDPYGQAIEPGDPQAIVQFVTNQGWDTRQCCGSQVVFRIQTTSGGVYIPNPSELPGSAGFEYTP